MPLTEEQKRQLLRRVAEVEKRTGVEIVTAFAARCDDYPEIPWKAFALGASFGAVVCGALALTSVSWEPVASLKVIAAVLAAGLVAALLAVFVTPFARLFLDGGRAAAESRQYAESLFLNDELFRTASRSAVLVLVAQFERRVVLLPDRGVRERVPAEAFDRVVAQMIPLLAERRVAASFDAGLIGLDDLLRACGFRPKKAKRNELPDKLKVRKRK
jgi:putative membrane protein